MVLEDARTGVGAVVAAVNVTVFPIGVKAIIPMAYSFFSGFVVGDFFGSCDPPKHHMLLNPPAGTLPGVK